MTLVSIEIVRRGAEESGVNTRSVVPEDTLEAVMKYAELEEVIRLLTTRLGDDQATSQERRSHSATPFPSPPPISHLPSLPTNPMLITSVVSPLSRTLSRMLLLTSQRVTTEPCERARMETSDEKADARIGRLR